MIQCRAWRGYGCFVAPLASGAPRSLSLGRPPTLTRGRTRTGNLMIREVFLGTLRTSALRSCRRVNPPCRLAAKRTACANWRTRWPSHGAVFAVRGYHEFFARKGHSLACKEAGAIHCHEHDSTSGAAGPGAGPQALVQKHRQQHRHPGDGFETDGSTSPRHAASAVFEGGQRRRRPPRPARRCEA
jgi:hypothetical protein